MNGLAYSGWRGCQHSWAHGPLLSSKPAMSGQVFLMSHCSDSASIITLPFLTLNLLPPCFIFKEPLWLQWTHLDNPGKSFKVSWLAPLIPFATLNPSCHIEHIHRFWGIGHGHLWGKVYFVPIISSLMYLLGLSYRSLKLRYHQGHTPSESSQGESSLPLPVSRGCWWPLACGSITPVGLHVHMALFPVSLFHVRVFSSCFKDTSFGLRTHLKSRTISLWDS